MSNANLVYEDLVARGKSVATARLWRSLVGRFEVCCGVKDKYERGDVIKFLAELRGEGVKQNSINTMIRPLRLLCEIQKWDGGFPKLSMPKVKRSDVSRPALSFEQCGELIIKARTLRGENGELVCSSRELAFVALATIYGLRREELGTVEVGDGVVKISTVKGGEPVEQLIPDCVVDVLRSYKGCNDVRYMTRLFRKITGEVGLECGEGYGWHSIRRRLATELVDIDVAALKVLRFMRWSDSSIQKELGMLALYARREQDKIDKAIFRVHPFVSFWENGVLTNRDKVSYTLQNVNSPLVLVPLTYLRDFIPNFGPYIKQ